jgi:hypothetical protein
MAVKPTARKSRPGRYAAKLLFQFRVLVDGDPGIRRLCEERIITFHARGGRAALAEASRQGEAGQHRYRNSDGNSVSFDFVGVLDLLELGMECEPNEVWYDIVERVHPMERRARLIPPSSRLLRRA